jgi:hypothetical protein
MNERIRELAEQAGYTPLPGFDFANELQEVFLKKFAELIVDECMIIIKQNENASLNVSNFTDEKKQGIQLGLEFAIVDIAEHFGVEEK